MSIVLENGGLGGTVQTNDGVCGLVCTGVSGDGYTLGTPLLLTGMGDLAGAGITQALSPFLYKQVKEFYQEAGDGALLYLMPIANTVTHDAATGDSGPCQVLLDYANGAIAVLGIVLDDAAVYDGDITTETGINDAVFTAVANIGGVQGTYRDRKQPFRAVIGATSYQGVPGDLLPVADQASNNGAALVLGDTVAGNGMGAAVGLVLGRLAKIPVQRKASRVLDGAISQTAYYYTNDAKLRPNEAAVIEAAGYITFKKYAGESGFFLTGDRTAIDTDDDYHLLARGRVIDKALRVTYATLLKVVDDEVPTVAGGKPEPMWAKDLETKIKKALTVAMVSQGEASAVDCTVPLDQDVVGNSNLVVITKLRPVGYATDIEERLGYEL